MTNLLSQQKMKKKKKKARLILKLQVSVIKEACVLMDLSVTRHIR